MLPEEADELFDELEVEPELLKLPDEEEVEGVFDPLEDTVPDVDADVLFVAVLLLVENEPEEAVVCGGRTVEPATGLFWNVPDVYERG
jgi:hypothetical protein